MWRTEQDARDAADWLAQQATNLELPWWSSRQNQLMRLATFAAIEKVALDRYDPLALVFSERLRELLDGEQFRELSEALSNSEDSLIASRRLRWRSQRFAG